MLVENVYSTKFLRSALALALPVAFQHLLLAAQGAIDVLMISQLGEDSLAAVGLGTRVHFMVQLVMSSIAIAAGTFVAQFAFASSSGHSNQSAVETTLLKCLGLGAAFALTLTGLLFAISDVITSFATTTTTIQQPASHYVRWLALACTATQWILILELSLRAQRRLLWPTLIAVGSVALNTLLNYILIFGHWGASALGSDGAAIATMLTRFIQCGFLLGYAMYSGLVPNTLKAIKRAIASATTPQYSKLIQTAIPIAINMLLWSLGALALHLIAGKMGGVALAAASFMAPVEAMSTALFAGLASACAVLTGNYLGATKNLLASKSSYVFLSLAIAAAWLIGVMVWFSAPLSQGAEHTSEAYQATVLLTLQVFAAGLWIRAATMILINGALRSGADNTFCTVLDMICMWGIEIPLAWVAAFVWNLNYAFIFSAFIVSEGVKLLVALHRLKSNRWQNNIAHDVQ